MLRSVDDFIRSVEEEAKREGSAAREQLRRFRTAFRLALQVRDQRKKLSLSQMELSKRTGLQQREISRIERGLGNPTRETLEKLGDALGLELAFQPKKAQPKRTGARRSHGAFSRA